MLEIKEAMRIPMIYKTIAFFIICGFMCPTFYDYDYYFYLNEIKFSELQVGMLYIVGYISLLAGILIY
jgi:hypothetical protein